MACGVCVCGVCVCVACGVCGVCVCGHITEQVSGSNLLHYSSYPSDNFLWVNSESEDKHLYCLKI